MHKEGLFVIIPLMSEARNFESRFVDFYDWTISVGIEKGPNEVEIRRSFETGIPISVQVSETYGDADPEDPDYKTDWGWQDAVVIDIDDTPEFGPESLTFIGRFISLSLFGTGVNQREKYYGSCFRSNYYPESGSGAIYIEIGD